MTQPPILTQLRSILVELYPDMASIRRLADDASVRRDQISFEGDVVTCWHALLRSATNQQRLDELFAVVRAEYPNHEALAEASTTYRYSTLPCKNLHLINFTNRPFTDEHRRAIGLAWAEQIANEIHVYRDFKPEQPFYPQCLSLVTEVGLSDNEWQTLPIVINPPGLSQAALCLMSVLHGRMGHFPTLVRLRPGSVGYEVAELVNLQKIRDHARRDSG